MIGLMNAITAVTLAAADAAGVEEAVKSIAAAGPVVVEETIKSVNVGLGVLGAGIGCGIIIFGAAAGIGKIAGSATEAIARQPEAGGRIFTSMLLAAALIEGATLFALIVCFFAVLKG